MVLADNEQSIHRKLDDCWMIWGFGSQEPFPFHQAHGDRRNESLEQKAEQDWQYVFYSSPSSCLSCLAMRMLERGPEYLYPAAVNRR